MQFKDKATDIVIGRTNVNGNTGIILYRCTCGNRIIYRVALKDVVNKFLSLKEMLKAYPDVTLYRDALTKEELEEVTPKQSKIILNEEQVYCLLGYNDTVNLFRIDASPIAERYFLAPIGTKKEVLEKTIAKKFFKDVMRTMLSSANGDVHLYFYKLTLTEAQMLNELNNEGY